MNFVASVETSIDFERHNVRLGLRLDRADRLPDGSLLVIDYKTGATKSLLKKDGTPADLQLVVYSSALGEDIGGLALINIDSRGIDYKVVGGSSCVEMANAKADPEAWPQSLAEWQSEVDVALRQLAAGDVRINMRHGTQEGRPFGLLSRIEELRRAE